MAPKRGGKELVASTSGTKKTRYMAEESDDDFQDRVPCLAAWQVEEEEVSDTETSDDVSDSETSDDEEVFQSRNSPKLLIDAIKALNAAQQKSVHEMGFGHLFHLELDEIPGRMTTWCLDRLDPVSCSIEMKDNRRLHLDANDVFLMFGFPKGPEEIKRFPRIQDTSLVEEWATRHGRKKNKVLPSQLIASMLAEADGGVWFKRDFLILVECCLIENASDGYVKPKVIDVIRDVSKIKQFNWCDHVINALHISHKRWLSNRTGNFTGPALFLVLFYVDRTIHFKRYVDRVFPLIKGWTADLLRQRQRAELKAGGFGTGFVDDRFEPASLFRTKYDATYGEEQTGARKDDVKGEPEEQYEDVVAYTNKLLTAAKLMADSMSSLMKLIKGAPDVFRQNGCFNNAVKTCRAVLGATPPASSSPECGVNLCSQKVMDDEFSTPEWSEALTRMMEVFEERQMMEDSKDYPSFSLGLSQSPLFNRDFNTSPTKADFNVDDDKAGVAEAGIGGGESSYLKKVDGQSNVVQDNVVQASVNVPVAPTGERVPSTKDDVNIDVEATLASILKVVKETHTEVESSEDEIPIIKRVKMSKKSDKFQRNVNTRTTGERHKASSLLSPFNVRKVSAEPRLETVDKQLFYWLISKSKDLEERILFNNSVQLVVGSDFQSFRPGNYLCATLLDAWSMYLNSQESLRSPESPSRFFCSTYPCSFTIVDKPKKWSLLQVREAFFERVTAEFNKSQSQCLAKSDLVFFPIVHQNHFYVMVFNLKGKKILLLDNSSCVDDELLCIKYGDIPSTLVQLFCDYLESHKLGLKAMAMRRITIDRMKMPWRNEWNKVDCAVYAMRHMEVYMGQTVKDWDIDLKKDPRKQLRYLRVKYCRVLLTCEINIFRAQNLNESKAAYNKTRVSDFDRFLDTLNKKQ